MKNSRFKQGFSREELELLSNAGIILKLLLEGSALRRLWKSLRNRCEEFELNVATLNDELGAPYIVLKGSVGDSWR